MTCRNDSSRQASRGIGAARTQPPGRRARIAQRRAGCNEDAPAVRQRIGGRPGTGSLRCCRRSGSGPGGQPRRDASVHLQRGCRSGIVTSRAARWSISGGDEPEGIGFELSGRRVWITSKRTARCLSSIPTLTRCQGRSVGLRPRSVAFLPDGSCVCVETAPAHGDRREAARSRRDDLGRMRAMGTVMAPDGKHLHVTGRSKRSWCSTRHQQGGRLDRSRPSSMGTPSRRTLRRSHANGPSNDVSVIVGHTDGTKKIPVGRGPWGIIRVERK